MQTYEVPNLILQEFTYKNFDQIEGQLDYKQLINIEYIV